MSGLATPPSDGETEIGNRGPAREGGPGFLNGYVLAEKHWTELEDIAALPIQEQCDPENEQPHQREQEIVRSRKHHSSDSGPVFGSEC